jgi:Tfp pilus assembly PilM family ATPase
LRHLVAGEVYQDQEPRNEVILMAAARETVQQLLAAAAKARLDVIGMSLEAAALIGCFGHIYRRKDDAVAVSLFVDIGCASSRAIIAQGPHILFARAIKVGGEHLNRAVGNALKISIDDAKLLRLRLCHFQPSLDEHRQKQEIQPVLELAREGALLSAPLPQAERAQQEAQFQHVADACREALAELIEELNMCRRYYESTFPNKPVDRLIFVGGEAKQRSLCQEIARAMALPAQVGDPLVRMARTTKVGIESGLDRRQPQPGWAVAVGLSLGPVDVTAAAA